MTKFVIRATPDRERLDPRDLYHFLCWDYHVDNETGSKFYWTYNQGFVAYVGKTLFDSEDDAIKAWNRLSKKMQEKVVGQEIIAYDGKTQLHYLDGERV